MDLTVTPLESLDALEQLGPDWDRLDASLSPRTPFTSRLWNTLWWTHFARGGWFKRDMLRCYSVHDSDGALVAVAPMMLTHRPAVGPWRLRELQFLGADPNITELRGLVCVPEHQRCVARALSRHLLDKQQDWDWVSWSGLQGAPPESGEAGLQVTHRVPSYYVALPADWEAFRARLPRNLKESLRKCYNSLKRDGLEFAFRVVRDAGEIDDALESFFELHSKRARLRNAVEHADVFAQDRRRAFLRDYARACARDGTLRIFQLRIGGRVVATRLGFELGRELYLYYSGYEPAWGRYSVMTTLLAETLKWAIGAGHSIVNLSSGRDGSKTRWRPQELIHYAAVTEAPWWRARPFMRRASQIMLPRTRSWH